MTDPIDILIIAYDAEYQAHLALQRAQLMNTYRDREGAGRTLNDATVKLGLATEDTRRVYRLIFDLDAAECSA